MNTTIKCLFYKCDFKGSYLPSLTMQHALMQMLQTQECCMKVKLWLFDCNTRLKKWGRDTVRNQPPPLNLQLVLGVITITTLHTLQNKFLDNTGSQPRAASWCPYHTYWENLKYKRTSIFWIYGTAAWKLLLFGVII